jgi:hypothetical protein
MAISTELLGRSIPPPLPSRDASGVRRTPDEADDDLVLWVEEVADDEADSPEPVAMLEPEPPPRRRGLLVLSTVLAAAAGALLALATDRVMDRDAPDAPPPAFASEPAPIELDPIVIDVPVAD